jgi:hypothetical protein
MGREEILLLMLIFRELILMEFKAISLKSYSNQSKIYRHVKVNSNQHLNLKKRRKRKRRKKR